MLSDLTTPNPWVNYLDYSMEYHKEYQINYPLVNLINLFLTFKDLSSEFNTIYFIHQRI